jgi:hypothetical protein
MKDNESSRELTPEQVLCYLYALRDEANFRGRMFPQTSEEQAEDRTAMHIVCEMVKWYGQQGYPLPEQVAAIHNTRANNRKVKDEE